MELVCLVTCVTRAVFVYRRDDAPVHAIAVETLVVTVVADKYM